MPDVVQPTLYPVKAGAVTITVFADHPAIGGPPAEEYEAILGQYVQAIANAIGLVSETLGTTLVTLT